MNIFRQLPDGSRVPVNSAEHAEFETAKSYERLITTNMMIVFRVGHQHRMVSEPAYKYGGRGNPRHPASYRGN